MGKGGALWRGGRPFLSGSASAIAVSKIVTTGANAVALFLAANILSPAAFGVFGVVTGAALVLGTFLVFGCGHAVLRLERTPAHEGDGPRLRGAALLVLCATATGLAALSALSLPIVDRDSRLPLLAAAGAAVGWACVDLAYWLALARTRHRLAVAAQAGTAAARVVVLAVAAVVTPTAAGFLSTWAISGLALGAVALWRALPPIQWPGGMLTRTLVSYARWQGLGYTLSALSGQQGALILLLIGQQPVEAGKFSLAVTLILGILTVSQGLFEHLSVSLGGAATTHMHGFLRASLARTAVVLAGAAALLAVIYAVAPLVLPSPLWADGGVFVPLALVSLLVVAHAPLEATLHGLLAPNPILWSRVIRLVLPGVGGIPVALLAGAEAMAWLHVAAAVASLGYLARATVIRLSAEARQDAQAAAARSFGSSKSS